MTGAFLKDIRVLDFGQFIAGPYCANLLGALGADVIRVERFAGASDRTLLGFDDDETKDGALYSCVNTNKRSLALDLLAENSREITDKLLLRADIIVANMPGAILKMIGIDQDRLNKIGCDAILVTCSAFGGEGEQKEKLGFDGLGQALSGAMHMTGDNGDPRKAYVHYVDFFTAAMSAVGAVVALREREMGGLAHHVETSLLGSALAMMNGTLAEEAVRNVNRIGSGNLAQAAAPANVYATKDGNILLQIIGFSMFKRWAKLVGKPEWITDARCATDIKRAEHPEVEAEAKNWFAQYTNEEALAKLADYKLSAGPICSPRETLQHSDVLNGDFMAPGLDPSGEYNIPIARSPVKFSGVHLVESPQSPKLGGQTAEILQELDFDGDDIRRFADNGLIQMPGELAHA